MQTKGQWATYTVCSQTLFTHGSYLGDTASLSVHEAGPSRPCGGKDTTTQRARTTPSAGQPRITRTPMDIMRWGRSVLPRRQSSSRELGSGLRVPPPQSTPPSAAGSGQLGMSGCRLRIPRPSLPQLAWALRDEPGVVPPSQASCLHVPVPRIRGQGNQGASVFRVCSRGLLSKINTRSSISTIQGGLMSQRGPSHHRWFGLFCFLLELARRGSEKAASCLEHPPAPLHLQSFWAPKVRSPTLRGPTRGRSPGDMLTLSWD